MALIAQGGCYNWERVSEDKLFPCVGDCFVGYFTQQTRDFRVRRSYPILSLPKEESMKIIKQIDTRLCLILILLLSVFVVVAFSTFMRGSSRVRASRQIDISPSVRSFVPNLKVVHVHVQDGALSLTLRNDYNKTITAFAVSSSRIITRSELVDADELAPGATVTKLYELPSSPLPEYATTLQAAVFDDGTADGNPKIINQILDARSGNKKQIDRILPTLMLDARNGDLMQQWQKIKSRIAELPNQEDGKSFEFNAALQDAKNLAALTIDELDQIQQKHGDDAARQRLANIKESYEVKSTKLQGALHRSQ